MNPPSETVELNRTSSVNLTCMVSGQPGAHMEWYKNGLRIPYPTPAITFVNGSAKSVLMVSRVKYKDRGSVVSCTAWYPGLPINATRNIHLLVHGMFLQSCVLLVFGFSKFNFDIFQYYKSVRVTSVILAGNSW